MHTLENGLKDLLYDLLQILSLTYTQPTQDQKKFLFHLKKFISLAGCIS